MASKSLAETFSKQHKGRKMSEETKRKISETRKRVFAERKNNGI